jgi:uncharacterized protein with von Willebrand factor type A (vWA) domain
VQATLEDFLRALRANEVAVSPAEAIDAHRAVAHVGYGDRILLRDALCATLAKTAEEAARFDACFDTFFARPPLAKEQDGGERAPREIAGGRPDLADLLLSGDAAGVAQALEEAAARAGAGGIWLASQRSLLTRRVLDEMGLREMEALINRLRASDVPGDGATAAALAARREALFDQAGEFIDRQAQLYASQTGRRLRDGLLAKQKLTAVAPEDFRAMEALVRRMARRLASRYARKRHRSRRGRLDVRKTIRRSMGYGGVPFDIVWKIETIEKPKIVVLCDVSRSVAAAAQFLLLFLYSLNEVVERLDAYAFSDRLVCVNDLLDDEKVDDAITLILRRIGFRPTDYGRALGDFCEAQRDRLDRRTTVIILGDARSNYANPRVDLMRRIGERARAVIWLNPEPETYWGQGDSKMDAYRRFCSLAKTCNTLRQLEAIIDTVLRTYLPR